MAKKYYSENLLIKIEFKLSTDESPFAVIWNPDFEQASETDLRLYCYVSIELV